MTHETARLVGLAIAIGSIVLFILPVAIAAWAVRVKAVERRRLRELRSGFLSVAQVRKLEEREDDNGAEVAG